MQGLPPALSTFSLPSVDWEGWPGGGSHAEVVSFSSSECTEAPTGVMANASGPCSLRQAPVGLEGYVVSTDIIRFLAFITN